MRVFSLVKRVFKVPVHGYHYLLNCTIFGLNQVRIGKHWRIDGRIFILNEGEISIGQNFTANSSRFANPIGGDGILRIVVRENGHLIMGNHVGISNSTIVCWRKIEIGDHVSIGGGCKIWDTDFHSADPVDRQHKDNANVKTGSVQLCDYSFIGGGSIILKGVRVGMNAVVAAGSVVTKSIPDNEIWGGNPAKFIRKL